MTRQRGTLRVHFAPLIEQTGADTVRPYVLPRSEELPELEKKKVTVVVYPDEDGGYTAIMPYFSCCQTNRGGCLTAQGWTAEEALSEARLLLQQYLDLNGQEGHYHLEYARLEGLEVRELEVEAP